MLTMVLGGLWHGASWNFVIWGFLHGLALIVHREFARMMRRADTSSKPTRPASDGDASPATLGNIVATIFATALTFYWVCLTWIFFRATTLAAAWETAKSFVLFRSPES